MIVCDKCASLIEEKLPEEPKPEAKDSDAEDEAPKKKRYYKNQAPKEEAPTRRTSLVSLPYKYGLNGYERKDFDLCDTCKKLLHKALDKVSFDFIKEPYVNPGILIEGELDKQECEEREAVL